MPGMDGAFEVIQKITGWKDENPVLFLTAESSLEIGEGLDFGGDDYIVKPFRPLN